MERREVSTLLRIHALLLECGVPATHLVGLDFQQSEKERRKAATRLISRVMLQAPRHIQVRLGHLLRNLLNRPFPHDSDEEGLLFWLCDVDRNMYELYKLLATFDNLSLIRSIIYSYMYLSYIGRIYYLSCKE